MSKPSDKRLLSPRAGLVPGVGVAAQDALNNVQPELLVDGSQCLVLSNRSLYEFRAGDTTAESLPNVVAPASGRPGRWRFLTSGTASTSTDVAVSADDTTPGPLESKVAAGDGIALETLNPGGNEQLEVRGASETPRILYLDVNSTATGTPDGSAARPFTTLQDAIDATDGTVNWHVYVAPGTYVGGAVIPANRRIRFSGLGATQNAVWEGTFTRLTLLQFNGILEIQLASGVSGPDQSSTIEFENITTRNGNINLTDAANVDSTPHLILFRNCQLNTPISANTLTQASTVVQLVLSGDGANDTRQGFVSGDPSVATSYDVGIAGPGGTTPQVDVRGIGWLFDGGVTDVNNVQFDSCAVGGPIVVHGNASHIFNTRIRSGATIAQINDSILEVDAVTLDYLRRNGQATTGGTIRLVNEPSWSGQATWYVDPASGSDDNSGLTSGTALATFAELQRRWGERPVFTQLVTINVLSDVDEPVVLRAYVKGAGRIILRGQRTVVASGTIQTTQSWDYTAGANGQSGQLTETGGLNFSGFTSRTNRTLLVNNSSGAIALVLGTLAGGTTAVVSEWGTNSQAPGPTQWLPSTPLPGDAFDVVTLTAMNGLVLDVQRLDFDTFGQASIVDAAYVSDLYFAPTSNPPNSVMVRGSAGGVNGLNATGGPGPVFAGCIWGSGSGDVLCDGGQVTLYASLVSVIRNATVAMRGCGNEEPLILAGCKAVSTLLTFANRGRVQLEGNTTLQASGLGFENYSSPGGAVRGAITVDPTSQLRQIIRSSTPVTTEGIYGTVAGQFLFGCDVEGRLWYNSSTPPILGGGSTNDNEIGGTARANGGLPYVEPTNNAMMVIDP